MSGGRVDPELCRRLAEWSVQTAQSLFFPRAEVYEANLKTIAAQLTAAAELAERPELTADEVRDAICDSYHAEHGSRGWGSTGAAALGVANRVAEKLAGRQLATAFDSASRAITGQSAADLNAKLDIEQRSYPSPGFDTSDVVPVESIGNWDAPDEQTTTPPPLKTMAEVQSEGGERPRVTETDPSSSE